MNKRLIFKGMAMAVLISSLIWPSAVWAQKRMTEWEALVRVKLAGFALLLSLADAHMVYNPYIGSLDEDTYYNIGVTLHRGVKYMLIGVCDDDCRNLNMELEDEDGHLIGRDYGSRPTADIEIIPENTQRFTVRIIMKRCHEDPCYYGLGVYGK
jgi:hypothetical protein